MLRWLLCLTLVLPGFLPAQDQNLDQLIARLGDGSSSDRDAAIENILNLAPGDYRDLVDQLLPVFRTNDDPEIRARARHILESLYRTHVITEGQGVFGFVLGWFLDHNGKEVTSWPLVLQVAPDTPAEKAGFKEGDVIIACNGVPTNGLDSRNALMRRLARLKPGTQTTFKIRFSDTPEALSLEQKNETVERTLAPMVRTDLGLESRFSEKEFRTWLSSFSSDDLAN
ncbi:MAG: PDZ domain-containing protein [Verrucomicrobiaceae bacterium]